MLTSAEVELMGQRIQEGDAVALDNVRIGAISHKVYRLFNNSFSQGGRHYGLWIQNIPKNRRAEIILNGEATVEKDYTNLHPRLLYALVGSSLTGGRG
jgi:hypothetical protein